MYKVSIIIPVWGSYKEFLPACLESLKRQTFKDFEIIIVDNKTDLPSARNDGIKRAKGEYILPLDVDDEIEPDYLEKTINRGDIVTTGYYHNRGENHIVTRNVSLDGFKNCNQLIACSLFKKKVWDVIGGYDESMKNGYEDWDFWYRAVKNGFKVLVIPEPLYHYNRRQGTLVDDAISKHEELKQYILNK